MNSASPLAARFLSACNFLSKGWEVSILGLLAFLQHDYSLSLYIVGVLSTVFIVCQIGTTAFAGKAADAVGSVNAVLVSMTAAAAAWLSLLGSHHIYFLYIAYALGGVSSGMFEPIATSLIAKRSSENARATSIGNFSAYGDMGRISLPAAATALAGFIGLQVTCAVLLATAIVAIVLVLVFRHQSPMVAGSEAREKPVDLGALVRNRKFIDATLAGMSDSFSSASLYIFIPFLLVAKGIALTATGWYIGIFFVGYLIGRLALGRIADRYSAPDTLIAAEVAMAMLIILLILVPGRAAAVAGVLLVLGAVTRGTSPIIRAMVADTMDQQNSFHNAFSAYSFASRGATAVCRPLFGVLAGAVGISAVFYVASAVSLVTLYPVSRYKGR